MLCITHVLSLDASLSLKSGLKSGPVGKFGLTDEITLTQRQSIPRLSFCWHTFCSISFCDRCSNKIWLSELQTIWAHYNPQKQQVPITILELNQLELELDFLDLDMDMMDSTTRQGFKNKLSATLCTTHTFMCRNVYLAQCLVST